MTAQGRQVLEEYTMTVVSHALDFGIRVMNTSEAIQTQLMISSAQYVENSYVYDNKVTVGTNPGVTETPQVQP
jgi:hypothetical protein